MAPTASRPVSPPLSTCLPLNDVRWMRRYPDRWPTNLTFEKHAINEKNVVRVVSVRPMQKYRV